MPRNPDFPAVRPHGCPHSHSSLVNLGASLAERLRLSPADRFWTALPMFHCGGIDVMMAALAGHCGMAHTGSFEPRLALRQLAGERCTVAFPAFETIWLPVLDHPVFATTGLSALRLVLNVGSPERMSSMQARLPHAVQISCLGMTESLGFCCVGSSWRPRWSIRRPGPTWRPARPGSSGAAEHIDAEGWFASGDQVVADELGRRRFLTRLGDVLKIGGENMAASELEGYLYKHPAVGIVQVVGAPDARYGEVARVRPASSWFVGHRAGDHRLLSRPDLHVQGPPLRAVRLRAFEWPMSGTRVQKFGRHAGSEVDITRSSS